MEAQATATDTLGATDSDTQTFTAGDDPGLRVIRRTFLENRINWGSTTDDSTWGPVLGGADDFNQVMTGPITLGTTLTMMRDCRITGVRLYKNPATSGTIPVGMWDADGTLLASKTLTWVADDGGWVEVLFDAPVDVADEAEYSFGYHWPFADTDYAASIWVWNNGQDTTVWPFLMKGYSSTGTGVRSGGTWRHVGADLTFSNNQADRVACNYYIDVIAEWTDDTPGYTGGIDYWAQWENASFFAEEFPIIVFWPNVADMDDYLAVGFNLIPTGVGATEEYITAFKTFGGALKWMPSLFLNDLSGPIAAMEDPDLADIIVGYATADEPEFNQNPWDGPPEATLEWRNDAKLIDSTRPYWLNLSRLVLENQGFLWAPAGVSAFDKEHEWREYASQTEIGSLDIYSLAAFESYATNLPAGRPNRYGLWTYPLGIKRMIEVSDGRVPIWGVVESTSEFPNRPTADQVLRAAWSMLIAGAKGIEFFDHRFADSDVTQDFGALLRDPPMKAMVTAFATECQTLKNALFAAEANLIESYTSTGEMAFAQGGYADGAKIPMHYSSRIADGQTYLFAQSIRDGETTATLKAASLAGATLTVIGESREVEIDEDGFFTDTFDDGDYTYHLYVTDAAPVFTAPESTGAPAITTDGTPTTGETVTCSTGTWTAVPSPTFTYQWQRNSVDISGATSAAHILVVGDEDQTLRCVVTATNIAGSDTANSGTITPEAPPVSEFPALMLSLDPDAYWRLKGVSDEVGGFTLTASGSIVDDAPLITNASVDGGSKNFTAESQSLSVTDDPLLRLTSTFSLYCVIRPAFATSALYVLHKHGHYRIATGGDGHIHAFIYTGVGDQYEITSTATIAADGKYHVALTWDGSTGRLYVNGVADGTVSTSLSARSTASHFCIGKDLETANTGWRGAVAEAAVFSSVVLSAGDIGDLYDAGTA